MNEIILHFIQKQKVATVCCMDEQNAPYCFNCFFAFDSKHHLLYFKSSAAALHSTLLMLNPSVAGTVLPDKLNAIAIKGLQFSGTVLKATDAQSHHASFEYHKKFPFALAMSGEVWTIQLEKIKMTDNSSGFGKKIIWNRNKATHSA